MNNEKEFYTSLTSQVVGAQEADKEVAGVADATSVKEGKTVYIREDEITKTIGGKDIAFALTCINAQEKLDSIQKTITIHDPALTKAFHRAKDPEFKKVLDKVEKTGILNQVAVLGAYSDAAKAAVKE